MYSSKVNVIIPVYNDINYIDKCITSLLSQNYKNIEIQILDNCSNDGTTELIQEKYRDRLSHIVHSKNFGPEFNFDLCISYARDDYTCIYHSDDEYSPSIIGKQVAFLNKNSNVAAVFCKANYINENGRLIGAQELNFLEIDSSYGLISLLNLILTNHNFLICPSMMIRTSILKELKNWDWFFKSSADLEMWLRIAGKYKIGVINEHLISYRISKKQWSEKVRNRCSRADFFIVTEAYINRYKGFISDKSLNDYFYLKIKDHFARIRNCKDIVRIIRLFRLFIGTLIIYKSPVYKKVKLMTIFSFFFIVNIIFSLFTSLYVFLINKLPYCYDKE